MGFPRGASFDGWMVTGVTLVASVVVGQHGLESQCVYHKTLPR
jgi:hypothetical protein